MRAVLLDGYTINPGDLSWDKVSRLCDEFTVYDSSYNEDLVPRIGDCEIVFTSKTQITRQVMEQAPNLKYIGLTATGYNNVDVKAAADLGIAVTNVPAYATDAVAQHTLALILELTNHVGLHTESVDAGEWTSNPFFCYWKKPITLLAGKSIGIIGYGQIGRKVGELAQAFGMTVNVYSRDREAAVKSDFVSLHCPLTAENKHMVNAAFIEEMKPGAVLLNTARGALVDEQALADALKTGRLGGAGLDVLETEPPKADCPLLGLDNCVITPHNSWAPKEMRQMVIDVLEKNLHSWLSGGELNRLDL
ncbi:MAG: D-2-hydroxyacid dehydrogenase [Firmicutes bacterium]|nr:D-2-hydroxyacid dehydrogenase [Bacillota bacterium]